MIKYIENTNSVYSWYIQTIFVFRRHYFDNALRGLRDTHQTLRTFPTLSMHNHTSRHFVKMGDFKCVCSFQQYSKKECNLSARNKSVRSIFITKNCSSSTREHLYGCLKNSREGVEEDGKLCLARVGLFDECGEDLAICLTHRNEFGLGWRPSKVCKYPEHQSKQKPYRGISRVKTRKIY